MMSSSRTISSQADGHWAEGHRGAVETKHLKKEVRKRLWEPLPQQVRWASPDPAGCRDRRGGRTGADLLCTPGLPPGSAPNLLVPPCSHHSCAMSSRLPCPQRAMKPEKERPKRRQFVVFCINNFLSFWPCWVFFAVRLFSSGSAWASHSSGFSCCGAQAQ